MLRKSLLMMTVAGFTASLTSVAVANSDYQKWLQQRASEYQDYLDKRDKEFTSFLKKQWKEIYIKPPVKKSSGNKPSKDLVFKKSVKDIPIKKKNPVIVKVPDFNLDFDDEPVTVAKAKPVITKPAKPSAVKPAPVEKKPEAVVPDLTLDFGRPGKKDDMDFSDFPGFDDKPAAAPQAQKRPAIKPEVQPSTKAVRPEVKAPAISAAKPTTTAKPSLPKGKVVTINYYGNKLKFAYDPKMLYQMRGRINKQMVSQFWSTMGRADFISLQQQFESQRSPIALNDWGYAQLVYRVGKKIYPRNKNSATMFTWFFMVKAGFRARIAFDHNVYLLLPTKQMVKQSHFKFAGVSYYPLDLDTGLSIKTGRVKTYDGEYPGANEKLDMSLARSLKTSRSAKVKNLKFSYGGKRYTVKVNYDANTVNFFKTYPSMDYDTYFVADVNRQTGHPILKQLGKIINGKSEEEAVNILMRFTQTAFKYKNDRANFGTENYLFPEETLHYTYSDCEDRVFMFAWLVKNLVGLKVLGLEYPGHFSAAVRFNEKVKGKYISYKGERYMLTEPTYKGGRVGQASPPHRKSKPLVIAITS